MKRNFEFCLSKLLAPGREGGFSDDPRDPGGVTNHGVTLRAWAAWLGHPVSESDMRALTENDVMPFYRHQYWEEAECDALPSGVDHCVFDFAVNSGPRRAMMALQSVAHARVDGVIGPVTLMALELVAPQQLVEAYCALRMQFLKQNPNFDHFGGGWTRRVNEVEQEALNLLKQG